MTQIKRLPIKIVLVLITLVSFVFADEKYSLRLGWGKADKNDLGEILSGEGKFDGAKTHVLGIDGGYLLWSNVADQPIDIYLKGSLYRFYENGYQDDFWEAICYLKAYYTIERWENQLRIGIGEGVSMVSHVPIVEVIEAEQQRSNNSKFLNYLDISVDVDVGRLLRIPAWQNTYIGYALKHRSGIFGLINNVKHGGSNYDMVYIEKKF